MWVNLSTQWGSLLLMLSMTPIAMADEPVYSGFQSPVAIVSVAGATYVSDWSANTVTRIDAEGRRSVIAKDIPAAAGLAVDGQALFVSSYSADYILRISPDGSARRVAENLSTPTGLAFARDGRLLVANRGAGEVVAVNVTTGQVTRIAGEFSLPVGVVEMEDGSLVVSQYGGRVTRVLRNGQRHEIGASFNRPGVGILADGPNAVLVVDNGASAVRRVGFDGASSIVAEKLRGSAVALGKGQHQELLVGMWGTGAVYRISP
ncbi:hypothetical protein FACS1894158_09480 [Betaproteobacteria bacterium]|nr:hypothetical protein FACS1894158_09480 [Betaproteobacteria bacterium]